MSLYNSTLKENELMSLIDKTTKNERNQYNPKNKFKFHYTNNLTKCKDLEN